LLAYQKNNIMKKVLSSLALIISLSAFSQNEIYKFHLDLNKINNDLLEITLETPNIDKDKIIYNIPKIVPGTYQIYDFGQYVIDLEAFDKEGKSLSVNQLDDNRWEISNAKTLAKLTYWVEDTWDADVKELVFEPGGTNIEKDANVILNNHGFFGYFDGMKNKKYELNITRPADFYGSTGLTTGTTKGNTDQFTTNNYMDLVDSPIMYNQPDTVVLKIGSADILLSVYSKNKAATAKELSKDIVAILEAQKEYLGGKLPIKKYAFLIYLYEGKSGSGGSGALEHSYSSLYYLPEMPAEQLSGFLVDVSAHEFFHIVTPLNIHSEEIGNFNYINPKMSKHLWMYEGVTEYFAGHVQVYQGMTTKEDYLDVIKNKLRGAERFNDELPFTEMSLGCLDDHKEQYGNVYQKGALIGLCLDILLREQSNGEKGMKEMMASLSKEYGKYTSFKDEELFDKIAQLSSPNIREFFTKYVEDNTELPLEDLLGRVGVTFKQNVKVKEMTLGGISLGYNPESDRLYITDLSNLNKFGKSVKYKLNDELVAINGEKLSMDKIQSQMNSLKKNTQEGDKITILVARESKGKKKQKKLKGKAIGIETTKKYVLEFDENASKKQLKLQKSWLNQ